MNRTWLVAVLVLPAVFAGCVAPVKLDAVEAFEWHTHESGNVTYRCNGGGTMWVIDVTNNGDIPLLTHRDRWSSTYEDGSAHRATAVAGAQAVAIDATAQVEVYFCHDSTLQAAHLHSGDWLEFPVIAST